MAMAHPNPGVWKNKVSRLQVPYRRVASAPPDGIRLRSMERPIPAREFENIRKGAKESWKSQLKVDGKSVTTYNGHHQPKQLDEPTQNRVRPSSRERMNKPHPPDVFLVTRMKKIDGCFSAMELSNTKKQRGSSYEDQLKYDNGDPPIQRCYSSMSARDRERAKMQTIMGQVPAQATEAWIKLSSDRDKTSIREAFKQTEARIKRELEDTKPQVKEHVQQQVKRIHYHPKAQRSNGEYNSTTKWVDRTGAEESVAVRKLLECLRTAPPRYIPRECPEGYLKKFSPKYAPVPRRPYYDFQIHPEWHMPWHKSYETVRR